MRAHYIQTITFLQLLRVFTGLAFKIIPFMYLAREIMYACHNRSPNVTLAPIILYGDTTRSLLFCPLYVEP